MNYLIRITPTILMWAVGSLFELIKYSKEKNTECLLFYFCASLCKVCFLIQRYIAYKNNTKKRSSYFIQFFVLMFQKILTSHVSYLNNTFT